MKKDEYEDSRGEQKAARDRRIRREREKRVEQIIANFDDHAMEVEVDEISEGGIDDWKRDMLGEFEKDMEDRMRGAYDDQEDAKKNPRGNVRRSRKPK